MTKLDIIYISELTTVMAHDVQRLAYAWLFVGYRTSVQYQGQQLMNIVSLHGKHSADHDRKPYDSASISHTTSLYSVSCHLNRFAL
jgi:hypothetical protein